VARKIIGFVGFQYNFIIFNIEGHKAFGSSKMAGDGLPIIGRYSDSHFFSVLNKMAKLRNGCK
jgi:hypothetical protein